jgi:hypothetical protein
VLEDTEENTLRPLIEAEAIRVIEALVLGAAIEGTRVPALEGLLTAPGTSMPLTAEEQQQVMALREQVGLKRTSYERRSFEPPLYSILYSIMWVRGIVPVHS